MRQTSNKQYNLVDNSDKIKDSLQAWNTNFEKLDEDITGIENDSYETAVDMYDKIHSVEDNIKVLADNYNSKSASGTSLDLMDTASTPIDDIVIGNGPELEQNGEPTPINEVAVKVVEGTTNLIVQSKNIVDWANGQSTYADINWENDVLTVSGTGANLIANFSILDFVKSHPGQTLHFGYESIDLSEFSSTSNQIVSIMITDNGTSSYATILNANGNPINYTIPNDTSRITLARIRIAPNNSNTESTSKIVITKPQLELGEESTEYVEYRNQTYTITLPTGTVLGKIDNASSYIYGDIDDWKLHRGIVGVTLNETWDWRQFSTDRYYIASSLLDVKAKPQSALYCNYFGSAKTMAGAKGNNRVYIGTNSAIEFYPDEEFLTQYPTVEDFKLWVSQHNLKVYYQANEPEDVDITDETLISQLNDIKRNMTTYKGQTIVFTATDNLHPNIDLTYKINGDIEVNEKVAVVQHQVDMLKSNFNTKTSEQSDSLEITDAINYTVENFGLYGKTEQNQYTGKNLLNGNSPTGSSGANSTFNNDIITVSSTSTSSIPYVSWVFDVVENDVIRVNGVILDSNGQIAKQTYNGTSWGGYSSRQYTNGTDISSLEYTVANGISKVRVLLYSNSQIPSEASLSKYKDIIVTKNNSDTEYEPYVGEQTSPSPDYPQEIKAVEGECSVQVKNEDNTKSQLATFPLAENQKLMQGDYLAEDGIHHVRGQVVLNGVETGKKFTNSWSNNQNGYAVYLALGNGNKNKICQCDKFIYNRNSYSTMPLYSFGGQSGNNNIFTFVLPSTITSVSDANDWLVENNLTVEYELAQEQIDPYTPEQQIAWEELQKLETYKDLTYIKTSSDDLAPNVEVTYLVNPLSSIEARLADAEQAIVAQNSNN